VRKFFRRENQLIEASGLHPISRENLFEKKLPIAWQIGIVGFSLFAFLIGFVTTNVLWFAPAAAIAIWMASRLAINEFYSLLLYIAMVFIIILQGDRKSASLIDFGTGATMTGLICWWFVRSRVFAHEAFAVSWEHLLFVLFFLWSLLIGLGGMIWFENTPNDWFREALIQLPMVLIPFLFVRSITPDSSKEKVFLYFIAATWIFIGSVNIISFRNNVVKAVYFYQTGRSMIDPSSTVLLLFATIAFASIEPVRSRLKWYVLPTGLAVICIFLSGYRTIWLTCIVVAGVLWFLNSPVERKQFWAYVRRFIAAVLVIVTYLFFKYQLVHLMVMGIVERFTSSAKVGTDPSLVNRYIEWRTIIQWIKDSPFVGYGYGGRFWNFDWLRGLSYFTGFTHNSVLYILFKTGIIGLSLILIATGGTMYRAFRSARSPYASPFVRALMRVAFCYMLFMIPAGLTLNSFAGRESLMWQAICWSFVWVYDVKLQGEAIARKHEARDIGVVRLSGAQ
jgi:O-antigen ligase